MSRLLFEHSNVSRSKDVYSKHFIFYILIIIKDWCCDLEKFNDPNYTYEIDKWYCYNVIFPASVLLLCSKFQLFLWGCCIKEQFYLPCKAHYMNRIKGVNEAIYVPDAYNSVILNRNFSPSNVTKVTTTVLLHR